MRRWLSVFFVGGSIAYRGLFNWIRPAMYVPTMLGSPLFQLIFFTKLGQFAHPWLFALSLPATVLALGLMGLVLASTFILYRNANALSNLLEYPVWIASGLVFSTSLLPAWTRPISWCLPPYWGVLAIRHAALGGDVWGPLLMVMLLGLVCLAIAAFTFRLFEHYARGRATLSLT